MAISILTATTQAAAINYTHTTSGSTDWSSIGNSTYFYDLVDKLPYYKNSSGNVLDVFSPGLIYFIETGVTTTPNTTVPVVGLIANSGTTNVDIAIVPKGSGAFILDIPDGTVVGGNKRGANAVDLQTDRNAATQVASGTGTAIVGGIRNTSNGYLTVVIGGQSNTASNYRSAVVGGFNNTASGFGGGFIFGGENNVASGNWSGTFSARYGVASAQNAIVLGGSSTSSNQDTFSGGWSNVASGPRSVSLGGRANTASASYSSIVGGYGNTASGVYSVASGGFASTQNIVGRMSHASGRETTNGDAQISKFVLRERTTDNTPTTLTTDSNTGSTNNQVILSNQSAYRFKGTIIGKRQSTIDTVAWDIDGLIVRGANATSTTLVVGNVILVSNIPGWGTPTLTADTTNGGLRVQVIGAVATNIQWTAIIETIEVIYA